MDKHSINGPEGRRARARDCLMCRTTFSSQGPHNRVCDRCKHSQAWREGSLDYTTAEVKTRR